MILDFLNGLTLKQLIIAAATLIALEIGVSVGEWIRARKGR